MEKNLEYTKREKNALLLYQGCGLPWMQDEFYNYENAYRTFNLLMMEGKEGEYVRVCLENQRPTEYYIRRWEDTMEVLTDLFTLLCKYAVRQKLERRPRPNPLERGDRGVNFRLMEAAGGTFAFTSTSKERVLDTFLFGKEEPHILHITLGDGVPYLDLERFLEAEYTFDDEHEVLLPPMIPMTCSACRIEEYPYLGDVRHYDIRLEGFRKPAERVNEAAVCEFLRACAPEAAAGLADLVARRRFAEVFAREDHIYWQWKDAFRKLTLQRMCAIYETYFE